jgi:hypothetical protein
MESLALRSDPFRRKRISVFGECPQTFGFEVVTHPLASPTTLGETNYATNEVRLNAMRIAELGAKANRRFPNEFPLDETVMDILSGVSIHELIHQVERIGHTQKDKWSLADFERVQLEMGHVSVFKLRYSFHKPKRKVHQIVTIDCDNLSADNATENRQQYIHTRRV